ncbi:unnamed protein product [Rotaria socialis]|uniref:Uncharacterized protein n=1 Tax=Rotaria socialis TaxID=392032 RepID=A0A818UT88_9BILA|nr:unnamed protein product [Rotaria socialis]
MYTIIGRALTVKGNDDFEQGTCQIWGDPHLILFPLRPSESRPQYWCNGQGEHIIYSNQWIKFIVTVTTTPIRMDEYKIIFLDGGATLCTITSHQKVCNNPKINVKTIGSTTDIKYQAASLRMVIVQYPQGQYYDIGLYQTNFTIIRQSSGICVSGPFSCYFEAPAAYRDYNRKRNILSARNPTPEQIFVNTHAQEICVRALQSARQSVEQLGLQSISETTENAAMISCINDLERSGDTRFANSMVQLSIFDTITTRNISAEQRNALFEEAAVILEAAIVNASKSIEQFLPKDVVISEGRSDVATPESETGVVKGNDDFDEGICHIWADPHLIVFPQRPGESRPQYWCKEQGEHIIYRNQWIKFAVMVTTHPYWIEEYKIIFLDGEATLCTITSHQKVCNNPKINVKTIGSTTDIKYQAASLRMVIAHYLQSLYYDINLYQTNFTIIRQSSGVCVSGSFSCELEAPAAYRDSNRKRNVLSVRNPTSEQIFVNTHAQEICEHARLSARQSVAQLGLPPASQTMEDGAMISCINDLEFSGDKRFANSVLQLSIFDTIATRNVSEEQHNVLFEQGAVLLETAVANASTIIEQFIVSENITLDTTTTTAARTTTTTVRTSETTTSTTLSTTVEAATNVITTTTSKIREKTGACYLYGDPHLLVFGQRLEAFQHQFWCRTAGQQRILLNEFIQFSVAVHEQAWQTDEFNITFFKANNTALCTVSSYRQTCNSPEIKITHPSQSQLDISYPAAAIRISIATQEYHARLYDIMVSMPYDLIHRSSGLCVMPPVDECELENGDEEKKILFQRFNQNSLSRQVCEEYLGASILAAVSLGVPFDTEMRDNALAACIHDYETTGNKDFGISIVNVIIKHGVNVLQLDDTQFELYTINSIPVIDTAIAHANVQVDTLLNTNTTDINIQTTLDAAVQLSSMKPTVTLPNAESSTQTGGSISVKLADIFLHFLAITYFIQFISSY